MKRGKIAASMMSANLDKIFYYLTEFKESNIELLHIDVMDGEFVSNLALGTDYVKSLRRITDIPFDYHFLVNNPLEKMAWYEIRAKDQVSFHYEGNDKIKECLNYLDRLGAKKFIAINPRTDFKCLDPYLDQLDGILVMMVEPGFAGQKLIPDTIDKVANLSCYLEKNNKKNIEIEVDGNITIENAAKLYKRGATIFVGGSSSLFAKSELSTSDIIAQKRAVIGWNEK